MAEKCRDSTPFIRSPRGTESRRGDTVFRREGREMVGDSFTIDGSCWTNYLATIQGNILKAVLPYRDTSAEADRV